MYGGEERSIQGVGAETRGKEPVGRFRSRWEHNVKMGIPEVGCEDLDCTDLANDRNR